VCRRPPASPRVEARCTRQLGQTSCTFKTLPVARLYTYAYPPQPTLAHKILFGIIHVPAARSMSDDMPDEERCPLCPSSGPILRLPNPEPLGEPSSNEDTIAKAPVDPDSIPDVIWIACSKCQSWYHSHCILLDDESNKTVPQAVMDELEKNWKDGWPFEDWTVWLNRWSVHSRCRGIKTNDQVL